jgi:hypothetical protein
MKVGKVGKVGKIGKGANLDKKHGYCSGKAPGKATSGGKSSKKQPCQMQRTGKYGVAKSKNTKPMGKL